MIKQQLYFGAHRMIGSSLGSIYHEYKRQDAEGVPEDTPQRLLVRLFQHCAQQVPYYAARMADIDLQYTQDPVEFLQRMPILTKEVIRTHFEDLKSGDLSRRKWVYNASGGSTGEPVKLIQDRYYQDRQSAIQLLSYDWTGRKFGERTVRIWGSEKDILQGSIGTKMKILNYLTNDTYLNAFLMTPEKMRAFIDELNTNPPQLIVAYVQAIYDLARFAQREAIAIRPQEAILTSAGTLYPEMRQVIESAFGCRVFDRYGSREVGDIACECSVHDGLHVFPWGNHVEILDDEGRPVPDGTEGNIAVTCLNNYAMPIIRYVIGDRGALSIRRGCPCGRRGAILEKVSGRSLDTFRREDGTLVNSAYLFHLIVHHGWVRKFQIVQHDYRSVQFRIVPENLQRATAELGDVVEKARLVMGANCHVDFEFLEDIAPSPSGKFRYMISHVHN